MCECVCGWDTAFVITHEAIDVMNPLWSLFVGCGLTSRTNLTSHHRSSLGGPDQTLITHSVR